MTEGEEPMCPARIVTSDQRRCPLSTYPLFLLIGEQHASKQKLARYTLPTTTGCTRPRKTGSLLILRRRAVSSES